MNMTCYVRTCFRHGISERQNTFKVRQQYIEDDKKKLREV